MTSRTCRLAGCPFPSGCGTLLHAAHERFAANDEGQNSDVYPALAAVPRDLFGICVAATDGAIYAVGDALYPFTIMSVSKPFVFALVCQALGAEEARAKLGVNSTGLPFNSVMAIELNAERLTNPMVNSGALATTSLVPGATAEEKWRFIHEGLSRFAGRTLALNDEVYASASATNHRNQGIARLLWSYDRLYFDPVETTDLYTRQCSLDVSARDLAVMGATLANGGVNPLTGEQVVGADRLSARAGRDGDGRVVRDLGRLALRHWAAREERHRRRDRHRRAWQGRHGRLRPATGRRGEQCQGATRCEVPLRAPGTESLCIPASRALIA